MKTNASEVVTGDATPIKCTSKSLKARYSGQILAAYPPNQNKSTTRTKLAPLDGEYAAIAHVNAEKATYFKVESVEAETSSVALRNRTYETAFLWPLKTKSSSF
jgi:hypothetical protein